MKRQEKYRLSEKEIWRRFFGTDDLKEVFGTDDPLEIIANMDEDSVGTSADGSVVGFEEEAKEWNEIIHLAKMEKARLDELRSAGSLEYLAEKLSKTPRQILTYCKKDLVADLDKTKGGPLRVDYKADTVDKTREAISGFVRNRKEGRLLKRVREYIEKGPSGPDPEEVFFSNCPEELLEKLNVILYECLRAAIVLESRIDRDNRNNRDKRVTYSAIAKMTGYSRTTIHKHLPNLAAAIKNVKFSNNVLVDAHIESVNNKRNGKVSTQNIDLGDNY
jgi:hypothetical protein